MIINDRLNGHQYQKYNYQRLPKQPCMLSSLAIKRTKMSAYMPVETWPCKELTEETFANLRFVRAHARVRAGPYMQIHV